MDPRGLVDAVAGRRGEYVAALREMVALDCGTYAVDGVNRIAGLCAGRFAAGGWSIERRQHRPGPGEPQLGDLVIGRLRGPGTGGPRVLLIGHMDTVFPEGTAAERPFAIADGRATGPGVSDMKAGLLAGFFAIDALREADAPFGDVAFVCNPDEEIGSPFSHGVIEEVARDVDVCFVLECARENGDIVSARKGVADLSIDIAGRAAHAGVEPERGHSAVLEAAHKVVALHALNGRWPGVTVNVGVIAGGTRPNVVAERCVLDVDLRAPTAEAFAAARDQAVRIAEESTVPGTAGTAVAVAWHRPMEKTEATARLVRLAREIAGEIGFEVKDTATGGASDANTTAAMGVPTLDGLGPVGGAAHSADEWLDLDTVAPRTGLLAAMIGRAGEALTGGQNF
jgi:glutamate carboxypeptidase